jgi:hypothetical protein
MRFIIFYLILPQIILCQNINFDKYFENNTMRIDYYHTGDADEEFISIDQIYKQNIWAGTVTNLIDPFNLGKYFLKVFDKADSVLIYSRGFSTYFGEYQTTPQAKAGIKKTFHESFLLPYPNKPVQIVLETRKRNNDLIPIYKMNIDPEDYHINTEAIIKKDSIYKLIENGEPHHCVDLVLLGEGYTAGEIEKFKSDLRKYSNILFSIEPFKSNSSKFNITGILSFSMQSGADEPTFGKYKNTVLNATFNSLDSPRYLLTADNKKIRNIASQAPYDLAYIMVNIERYGGGGIYNTLGLFTASEVKWNDYVFLHEFGHFFAALGDEYYTSSVAYDEFYPRGVEPLEANLTALLDPDNVKWKSCLSPGIKVPTEWGKAKFDSMHTTIDKLTSKRNELIDSLKNCRAPQSEISRYTNTYNDRINDIRGQIDDFISNHPLRGKIGVFEGAGYSAEGLYRPTVNSIMHKFDEKDRSYYKVNEAHLQKMINYYCK